MSFDEFLEHTMENAPPEIERNFTLITDLDRRAAQAMDKINELVKRFENCDDRTERDQIEKETMELFDKLLSYSDDKIELADTSYDIVNTKIECLLSTFGQQTTTSATPDDYPVGYNMPIDNNEPRFCICKQVSYGEMVGCDNKECPDQWFHLPCVGVSVVPKGKWYCPGCTIRYRFKTAGSNRRKSRKSTRSARY